MNSHRITCVIYSLGCGGAERVMASLAGGLAAAGYHVTLLVLNPDIPAHYPVSESVTKIGPLGDAAGSFRWFDWRGQQRRRRDLRQTILATRPAVVISFMNTTNVAVLRAMSGSGVPVIVSEHTDPRLHEIGWRWSLLRRLAYPEARRVVVLTQAVKEWVGTLWPRWRPVVIPNPVEMGGDAPLAVRPAYFGGRTLAAMGRLVPVKGFDLLIRAFAQLAPRHGKWNLVIYGEGAERAALERQIADAGLQDRVHLPGIVQAPATVLPLADLFVVSSRYEGFCLALAEAMGAGLAAVSFNCPSGPAEIINDGVDGVLVPPEDVGALTATLDRLMTDEAERRRLGGNAVESVQRYAPARIMALWLGLIDEVLAEAPSKSPAVPGRSAP